MKKLSFLAVSMLIIMVASSFVLAGQGDQKIRFGLQYVSPTGDLKESFYGAGPWIITVYPPEGEPFDVSTTENYVTETTEADAALGLFFDYEYMVTDLIGIDANLAYSKHDIDHPEEGRSRFEVGEVIGDMTGAEIWEGDISMMPISVGVNFHVMQKEKIDFYVGPFISYVMYGDVKWDKRTEYVTLTPDDPLLDPLVSSHSEDVSNKTKIKSDFGFGAVVGIDVPFGNKGWMFSSSLKYLSTKAQIDEEGWTPEIDVNPWILNIGVGYKF